MDRIRHILLGEVVGLLLIVLVIIILFETNFVLPGEMSGIEWSNDLVVTQFVMQNKDQRQCERTKKYEEN